MQSFRLSGCTAERLRPDNLKLAYKTTRRGLAAAVPVFVAMVAAHRAVALAHPPSVSNHRSIASAAAARIFIDPVLRSKHVIVPKGVIGGQALCFALKSRVFPWSAVWFEAVPVRNPCAV